MLSRVIGDNIELVTELNPSLGLVRGDTGYMHQVLLNLAANSRDAMPKGGKLIISLSNVDIKETPSAVLGAMEAGSYVRLRVTDTGTGMNAEVQEHLFEPFFTTNDRAKGLDSVFPLFTGLSGRWAGVSRWRRGRIRARRLRFSFQERLRSKPPEA